MRNKKKCVDYEDNIKFFHAGPFINPAFAN